jgi:hypothetical protein
MDGNDSLKRFLLREPLVDENVNANSSEIRMGESRERQDSRNIHGDYYLSRAQVDNWAKEMSAEAIPVNEDTQESPCVSRWHNMINDVTSKMWGIFDETGIFLSLCRHGFVMMVTDMVRSGEL